MVAGTDYSNVIRAGRIAVLSAAVELEVDEDELVFESEEERRLWAELKEEFQAFVTKLGPVWIAD